MLKTDNPNPQVSNLQRKDSKLRRLLAVMESCVEHFGGSTEASLVLIFFSASKKIVQTEYPNLSNPEKIEYEEEFFVRILNPNITFFTFLLF